MKEQHPSLSTEQKAVEQIAIALFRKGKNIEDFPLRDFVSSVVLDDCFIAEGIVYLIEVYAHVGKLKGAQPKKIGTDILKLIYVEKELEEQGVNQVEKVILFVDKEPYHHLQGQSWMTKASERFNIKFQVMPVGETIRENIKSAQARQRR